MKKSSKKTLPIEAQKKELRLRMLRKLKSLTPVQKKTKSLKIAKQLLETEGFKKAQNILMYASLPSEVQTPGLIRQSLKLGKKVFLPKINPETRRMKMGAVKNFKNDLVKGSYGILEPRRAEQGKRLSLDLILVPGLAFDREGRRLGRGAGYYDRFLESHRKVKRLGLAFREQLVKRVPVQSHDIRMHQVITD